jgi:RNA polymerase sigma factor (sigma-70 family)
MTVIETSISDKERDCAFYKFSGLIGPIACRFAQEYRLPSHEVEDLKQAGAIGLLNAAARQGDKLTQKYANESIKNEIWRHCKEILESQGRQRIKEPVTGKLVWSDDEFRENDPEDTSGEFQDPAPATDPLENLIVREGLASLDPEEAEVIRLRFEIGLSERETATEMGLNRSKITRLQASAKEKLKYLRNE